MPVYRCKQCGHVSESPVAGLQVPCAACQAPCSVYDTAFYLRKLIERYSATVRELKLLQAESDQRGTRPQTAPATEVTPPKDEVDLDDLATAQQHAPLEGWLRSRKIGAEFDHSNVDTSGYFDEAAQQLGQRFDLLGELVQRVAWSYRKSHTGLNVDLTQSSQKDVQTITQFCRDLYTHALFSRYHYQKPEKVLRLSLQPAPKVRQFFEGAWLEWYALLEVIAQVKRQRLSLSCARGVKILFPNEDVHELDVLALPGGQGPVCIECKTGEFRRDIDKYQRLRKRLGIDQSRFVICVTELADEQAASLSAMYDLTFVNVKTLRKHLKVII